MKIVVTCGDINGIGPEISLKAMNEILAEDSSTQFIFIAPENIFERELGVTEFAHKYSIVRRIKDISSAEQFTLLSLGVRKYKTGYATKYSGEISLRALECARVLIEQRLADALVTAPISKEAISLAGSSFPGHTELLADWFDTKHFIMMFYSKKMIGALLSIHIPLQKVSKEFRKKLKEKVSVINSFLTQDLGIVNPGISILGINPHAGENGHIGKEDEYTKKILESLDISISGPFPADAYFGMKLYKQFDCTISGYHDQLLIPFKLLSMTDGVNVTAGLPFVRTSPDHGTAFGIAGQGIADHRSMISAIKLARTIAVNRTRYHAK